MILDNAAAEVAEYNRFGLHCDLVTSGIYEARRRLDPFSDEYLPYIVAETGTWLDDFPKLNPGRLQAWQVSLFPVSPKSFPIPQKLPSANP